MSTLRWILLAVGVVALPGCGDGEGGAAPSDAGPDSVNLSPVAAFEASPPRGASPLLVHFDASASVDPDGAVVAWTWDFGDGSTGAGEVASHTLTDPGTYTVTLTVEDDGGATDSAATTIVVEQGFERTEESGVVFGAVYDTAAKAPLADARVTIAGVDGVAFSGEDGRFRAATPGPGTFALTIGKEGYGYAHRTATVEQGRHAGIDPAYLQPLDPAVTTIDAAGGTHTSADGEVRVEIPPGATPSPIDVRATNLDHQEELPAPLPEKTDFTYCVRLQPELMTFAEPVTVRVANSLDFPPGTQIPVGIYREDERAWRHEALATVSADGAWVEWETRDFSAHDINFYQRTLDESTQAPDPGSPRLADAPAPATGRKCKTLPGGSAIGVRDGDLVVTHDLPTWRSVDRLRGLRLEYSARAAAPTALLGADATFEQDPARWAPEGHAVVFRVGGEVQSFRFEPFEGTRRFAWLWQPEATGPDAAKTGTWPYVVELGNDYAVTYWSTFEFAGAVVEDTGVPGRQTARRRTTLTGRVPLRNLAESPLGAGWAFAGLQQLFREPDGTVAVLEGATGLTTFEGGLAVAEWPPGSDATFTEDGPDFPEGLDFDALGRLYVSSSISGDRQNTIWRLDPDGTLTHVAGDGSASSGGDGGPATLAQISKPHGLEVDDGGSLYVAELDGHRVRRIDANGVITTVAGTGAAGFGGDGGDATDAQLDGPIDVALDAQGNLYIADLYNLAVRRVDATGTITTIASGADLGHPSGVDVDRNGNVLVATQAGPNRLWRIGPEGRVALTPPLEKGVFSVTAAPDGWVWYRVWENADTARIERVSPAGVREVMVGGGTAPMVPGAIATEVLLDGGFHLAFDPLGRLVVGSHQQHRFFRLVPASGIPGREAAGGAADFTTLVFDADGAARRTYPDGTVVEFDGEGRQTGTLDRNGNRTTWEWDDGRLVQRVDPGGLATELSYEEGHLAEIRDPAGRATRFEIDGAGDLVRIENPDGGERAFAYDAHRMVSRREPMGETTAYEIDAGGVRRVTLPDGSERTFASQYGGPLLGAGGSHFWEAPLEADPAVAEGVTDATGATSLHETNAFGSIVASTDPLGGETRLERDADDLATAIHLPGGGTIRNEFDPSGRIVRFEDPRGAASTVAYEGTAVSELVDPKGVVTRVTSDAHGNPTRAVVAEGTEAQRTVDATWDARGLLTKARDPDGHETIWRYDARGLVTELEDPLHRVIAFAYDGAGSPVAVTDAAGQAWRLAYDAMGRVVEREDPLGHTRRFEYDASGRPVQVTDELGGVTTFELDPMGRIVRTVDPLGEITRLAYDAEGFVVRVEHPDEAVTTYAYDEAHRLLRVTERGADGAEATLDTEHDARGQVVAIEDASGSRWSLERDLAGRIVARVGPDGARTEIDYDPTGRVVAVRDPRGRQVALTYDAYGLLRRIEDPMGLLAEREHDGAGRVTRSVDALGGSVSFTYDAAGQLTAVTDELGHASSYSYDVRGQLVQVLDPEGRALQYTYDAAGRRIARLVGEDLETRWELDAAGRAKAQIDALDRRTEWARDALGRVLTVTYPDGSAETFAYDARGRLVERGLPDGSLTRFTYDGLGRLTAEDGPGAEDATYTWHPDGLLASATNASATVTLTWDAAKRLVRRTQGARETGFAHDVAAGTSVTTYPSGLEVTHRLDLRGRLMEVLVGDDPVATFGWDALNRPTWRSVAGLQTSYGWSQAGELIDLAHGDAWHRSFAYDAGGRLEAERDLVRPERSWRYVHDEAGRLASATRGAMDGAWAIAAPLETRSYAYDEVGNVLQAGGTSFTYDALDRVLTAGGDALEHDAAGRLTGDAEHRYEYDARGRLVRAVRRSDGAEALAIAYDALGERVLTQRGGEAVEHVTYGGMVLEEREGHGVVARRFVYGASGRDLLLALTGDGERAVLQDRLGSVVGLVDGALVERAEYGPYGDRALFDGAGAPLTGSAIPFGFTGQRHDPDTGPDIGWIHFRHRSYAPELLRFVSRDPAGAVTGGSRYEYALSDPVDVVDPNGDCPPVLLAGLLGANAAMWLYNMQHACGNPLFPSSYVGTDWNGWEQAQVGLAGGAAGAAGAYTFGATASALGAGGMGAFESYLTAGIVSGVSSKAAEDIVMNEQSSLEEYQDAAVFGGATGGLGFGIGRVSSALKVLNAVDDINPKAALALSEEVLNPQTTKVGYAGRVHEESQLLKNLTVAEARGGTPTPGALKGDIDMWTTRQMTQAERVDLASAINKKAGTLLVDAHPTHGVLSDMAPANLVVDEVATAQLGKLQFRTIPTRQLFEEGALIVKPSTGAFKYVAPRPVLEIDNPMPALGAFMLPLGPVLME